MEKIKILFQHMTMIAAGITAAISIEAVLYYWLWDRALTFEWHMPVSIVIVAVFGALPSLILFTDRPLPRRRFHFRIFLHCMALYLLAITVGYFFDWYDDIGEFIFVSVDFFLVYGFVWFGTMWLGLADEKKINEAIKNIQDEE